MDRRSFLRTGLAASLSFPALKTFGPQNVAAQAQQPTALPYDLVAVRGGEPIEMITKGMESLGTFSAVVKKGSTVVVKPNIGWDVAPELAANTNPQLVGEIVRQCYTAGAKRVYVFDNTCDNWKRAYKNSGIEQAAQDAGATVAPANSESYYQEVLLPWGEALGKTKVHELILSADLFINVPILKHHGSTQLTIAMKNLMGIIWNRGYWHWKDLHQCIADFAAYRKPDLNIVDAYAIMKTNGPRGVSKADVQIMKSLLISRDMVAIDAAAARLFGSDPKKIRYIRLAEQAGIGTTDLESLKINRIALA